MDACALSTAAPGWLGAGLRSRFDQVAVILSPPRCGSTVLALSLWHHRLFRAYLHEPFDCAYHYGLPASPGTLLGSVLERTGGAAGVVIKEMTFQVGADAAELTAAATLPVVLLVRDPRLSVWSRMRMRQLDGLPGGFPAREAGWQDLAGVRDLLTRAGVDYVVVDISDVRTSPAAALKALCARLGLPFDEGMVAWQPVSSGPAASRSQPDGMRLGGLGGSQDRWYDRVLGSSGFEPPDERLPDSGFFRAEGMLDVVAACLAEYTDARADPHFLPVDCPGQPAGVPGEGGHGD